MKKFVLLIAAIFLITGMAYAWPWSKKPVSTMEATANQAKTQNTKSTQVQSEKAFMDSLKGMTPAQKKAAIKKHHAEQKSAGIKSKVHPKKGASKNAVK